MGLFSTSPEKSGLPWTRLTSTQQLEEALQAPSGNAKVFFKHSTRCGISAMALRSFEKEWKPEQEGFELYFIDLLAHRDVSNAIAEKLHVTHQSPQVIVVRGNEVVYDASHGSIDAETIQKQA